MTVSPDPGALREGVRETAAVVAARHPGTEWLDHARAGRRLDSMWRDMAEAGLLGLGIPEESGGSGGGVTELAIVMSWRRRACRPCTRSSSCEQVRM